MLKTIFRTVGFLFNRAGEPSTWAGIAPLLFGLMQLLNIEEAGAIAAVVEEAIPALTAGDWSSAVLLIVPGLLAVFLKEKSGPIDLTEHIGTK